MISKSRFKQIFFSIPHYFAEIENCRNAKDIYLWFYFKMPYLFPMIQFPVYLDVELTNFCNLNCVHCLSQRNEMKRDMGFMAYDLFKKITDEFSLYANRSLLICGLGEPCLHPNITDILNHLSEKKIRYSFYTNGTFLKKFTTNEIVNWNIDTLVVSVDGLDNESYGKIRIGKEVNQYDVIKDYVSTLFRLRNIEGKKNPRIEIRHVIFPNENSKQLVFFRDEWMKIADAVKFNFIIPSSGKLATLSPKMRQCRDIRRKMHVRWDGRVPVCGYQYIHNDYEWLGDAQHSSIKEMWNHARLQKIRCYHKNQSFDSIPFCQDCVFTQT